MNRISDKDKPAIERLHIEERQRENIYFFVTQQTWRFAFDEIKKYSNLKYKN